MDIQPGQFMRIDAREGYIDKINALIMIDEYPMVFGARHLGGTGENPHYHLVIKTKVNPQAFRVRMKKIFDQGKGNGHMSIKPWDGSSDACSQLFHEKDAQIVIRKGVSDAQINEFRQRNDHVQEDVKNSKEKASHKIEEIAYERLLAMSKTRPTVQYDQLVMETIVQVAFDCNKYVPNPYLARSMMQNIQYKLCGGDPEKEKLQVATLAASLLPPPPRNSLY